MTQKDNAFGLCDFVDGFLFSLQADGRASRTQDYYRKLLKHFLQYADTQAWPDRIDFIDTEKVRYFLSWVGSRSFVYVAGNGSQRPIRSKHSVAWPYFKTLRRLFNWGIETGLVSENPVRAIHFKRPRVAQVQPYYADELERFLTVCDFDIKTGARFTGIRNKAMLLLFVDSGLRLSELAGLRVGDLDLEQKYVRVTGKGNKPDICPFSAKTAKSIWLYLIERKHRAKTDFFGLLKRVCHLLLLDSVRGLFA